MLAIVFAALLAASLGLFVLPKNLKYFFALFLSGGIGIISIYLAIQSLNSSALVISTGFTILNNFSISIDALSAFFILLINITSCTALIYGGGYLKNYTSRKTGIEFSLHYFNFFWLHASMLLLTMLNTELGFLIAWEIMSVSSFVLVIFNSERKEVISTGIKYLVLMHIAFFILFFGFEFASVYTGISGFAGVAEYFRNHSNWPLFLVFFAGFGIKAGFVPLHTWLPHAHPAAPSHVSGLMSGVMIKMGIYGILRVLLYVQNDLLQIGIFILIISVISGLYGVILAIVQHDLKKLLAYHSIENIGIIGIGIGLGVIGLAEKNFPLAFLGFSGGILHVLNHSLFKSLLFYSAGSVYSKTHTLHIDHLGGLIKKMPYTALFFLVASLAICGLPPFNGFISEFLIYSGLLEGLGASSLLIKILILSGMISLVLIGGLAIFCFTKAFGIVFLGTARSKHAEEVTETETSMLIPQAFLVLLILAIGVLPVFFIQYSGKAVALFVPQYTQISVSLLDTLQQVGLMSAIFIGIAALIYLMRTIKVRKNGEAFGPTWGCGYIGGSAKVQYTASSYADNYAELVKPVLGIHADYEPIEKSDIFPAARGFESHVDDKVEIGLIGKPLNFLQNFLKKFNYIPTWDTRNNLLYAIIFLGIIVTLTFLNVI
ncbi:MAG: proton-conducting transporter membrane subunit [Cytophagaceae bacterium]